MQQGDRREPRGGRFRVPFDNALAMGVIFYLLILAAIVFGSAAQYRFFYGTF
jgi:hypothetical protein